MRYESYAVLLSQIRTTKCPPPAKFLSKLRCTPLSLLSPPKKAEALYGTVGPGRTISLRKRNGAKVGRLDAGVYTLVVHDRTRTDNFHLLGLGVNKKTGIKFAGSKTWTIALSSGKTYRFRSDAHRTLRGSFRTR